MNSLIGHVVEYLLAPLVFLSHIISFTIFYSLLKESDDVGQLVKMVVKQELMQLLLWIVLPADGLATALSLMFCLRLYDSAVRTFVAVYQSTTVTTGQCSVGLKELIPLPLIYVSDPTPIPSVTISLLRATSVPSCD